MRTKLAEFGIDPDTLRPVATSFGAGVRRGRSSAAASESPGAVMRAASELPTSASAPALPALPGMMPSLHLPGASYSARTTSSFVVGGAAGTPAARQQMPSSSASSASRGSTFFAQHTMGVLRAQREALTRSMLAMSGTATPPPARRALHTAGSAVISGDTSSRGSGSDGTVC